MTIEEKQKLSERIEYLEKNKLWDTDVDINPPTIVLEPDQVDYLNEKISSKIRSKIANFFGWNHIVKLVNTKQFIIKEVVGLENFSKVEGGAIITCNHFNRFDNFALYYVMRPYLRKKLLYKVIREGNYTNFPGFYGYLFKGCNTLPLSSNKTTMKNFLNAVKTLLGRGEKILIYPEQALWTNYKKPRPLQNGAFHLATSNNCPIIPAFITFEENKENEEVLEFTIHFAEAIYPNEELTKKENIDILKEKNYNIWKDIYERVYGVPLSYL